MGVSQFTQFNVCITERSSEFCTNSFSFPRFSTSWFYLFVFPLVYPTNPQNRILCLSRATMISFDKQKLLYFFFFFDKSENPVLIKYIVKKEEQAYIFHYFKLINNIAIKSRARSWASAIEVLQQCRIMVTNNSDSFTCNTKQNPHAGIKHTH